MDGDAHDLELLLESAQQEIAALRDDPRMTEVRDGNRGTALREHLGDLVAGVEHLIAGRPPAGGSAVGTSAFARQLRQSIGVLRSAHVALPWLSAARTPNINLGSLYLAEELARILVGEDADLVIVPDQEFMYSTTSWPFSRMIFEIQQRDGRAKTADRFQPRTIRCPIVLNYPLTDADRVLLHPILAHELGHAAIYEHDLVAKACEQLRPDGKWSSLEEEVVWAYWAEELLCDHLATEAMGPAFVLALAAFATPIGYNEPSKTHPPTVLRLQLAFEHLDSRGWRDCMRSIAPEVDAWLARMGSDAKNVRTPSPFTRLRTEFLASGPAMRAVALERVGEETLDVDACRQEAIEAARLLSHRILPVGLDGAMKPRSILLGGWKAAIEEHGDRPRALAAALRDEQMQELIGKAIELSAVASSWKEAR